MPWRGPNGRFRVARLVVLVAVAIWSLGAANGRAAAPELELVLLIDVSTSVNKGEYLLQMRGIAAAFRDPAVQKAIADVGGIAVAAVLFSGLERHVLAMDWRLIASPGSAEALAGHIENVPRPKRGVRGGGTAIGSAIARGVAMIIGNGVRARRQVIDVSGDGHSNVEDTPAPMRDAAVSVGITVNGVAIISENLSLVDYFRDHVIGGEGAFVVEAEDFLDYARAIRLKLLREIRGLALSERRDPAATGPSDGGT